jgi:hypothetical protein
MAVALEASVVPATSAEVAAWVLQLKETELAAREARISTEDSGPALDAPAAPVTVPPEARKEDPRSRRAVALGMLGLVALASVVVLAWPPDVKPPSAPPSAAPAPPPTLPPVASSSAVAEPAMTSPSVSAMKPSAPIAAPRPPAHGTAAPSRSTPPKAADCPPYYVDDAGVRRFNRECLQ